MATLVRYQLVSLSMLCSRKIILMRAQIWKLIKLLAKMEITLHSNPIVCIMSYHSTLFHLRLLKGGTAQFSAGVIYVDMSQVRVAQKGQRQSQYNSYGRHINVQHDKFEETSVDPRDANLPILFFQSHIWFGIDDKPVGLFFALRHPPPPQGGYDSH